MGSTATFESVHDLETVHSSIQDILQRLLATTQKVENDPIIKIAQPEDVASLKKLAVPSEAHPINEVIEEAFTIFDYRMRVNHPRFMGFIPSPTLPISWLGDCIASAFNALGASKLQASGPVVIEKTLVDWLARQVGLPSTAGGICVSGGSMANLMGLVLARDRIVPPGKHSQAIAYLSDQTHYSVSKALRLLGFDRSQIRIITTDDSFQLQPHALEDAIRRDQEAGMTPFVVIANFGSTNTGTVDPLPEISQVCRRTGVWLHVDGAFGASAALSASRSATSRGLAVADSLSWDAHKWLFQTYSCGLLIVKDKKDLVRSFANDGDYLRDGVAIEDEETPNFWNYTMELTRPASRAMKLWFTLRVLGTERLGKMLDHGFDLAERAQEELQRLPQWEITSPASLGVVTFRFAPEQQSEEERDTLNARISNTLVSKNIAGILTTKIRGKVALRICALSPYLSLEEMSGIIETMNQIAQAMKVGGVKRENR